MSTVVFVVRLFLRRIRLRERKNSFPLPSARLLFVLEIHSWKSSRLQPLCRLLQRRSSVSENEKQQTALSARQKNTKIRFQFHEWTANRCQMMNGMEKQGKRKRTKINLQHVTSGRKRERSKSSEFDEWKFCEWKGDEGGWSLCGRNTEWGAADASIRRKKV